MTYFTPTPTARPGRLPPPVPPACPDSGIPAGTSPDAPATPVLGGVSVVLPCFNEADNVADAIRAAAAAASASSFDYEVIVIDDGSSDATAEIVAAFARRDHRVRLVVHADNRGYGDAVRSGISAARMPWTLLTDADLQFDLTELESFVALAEDADLIVGWRMGRQDPMRRRVNAAAWNWLMRRLYRLPVRDVDCAFKLVRTEIIQTLPLTSTGAMIDTELLVRALAAGARLRELGVHHRARVAGEQSGGGLHVVVRAFRELGAFHSELRGLRRAPTT